jgi:hypothetical protein
MRLSSGRRAPPCALPPERGGRAVRFSRVEIIVSPLSDKSRNNVGFLPGLNISGIVKLHGFQLTPRSRLRG